MKGNIRLFPILVLALVALAPPAFSADPNPGPNASSVACYFGTLGSHTWKWGLQSNNGWYSMTGHWSTTQLTKTQKFFTAVPQSEIVAACENARRYYKVQEPLFAAFAATSSVGSNHPIISQGVQLYPTY
ncbi:MAG TPA: hypothetical protein VI670_23685 [Thermoanaerobaculia bacterium]|jgi:hypothetical protein